MTARIAYLVPRFPKLSETFVADEIEALERRGASIELYALRPGGELPSGSAARRSARVASLPLALAAQAYWLARAPRRLLGVWRAALGRHRGSPKLLAQAVLGVGAASAFAIRMQRQRVEHVHAHFATHSTLAAWAIQRLCGIPYSFTAHADDIFVRRPMLEEKLVEARFAVTISEFNRRLLVRQVGEQVGSRIQVVHCGVDARAFAPLPPAQPDSLFTILCVGRLEPKKGQLHLIEACRRLDDRGIAFRCLLVGEGRERERLERARSALGLRHRVELLGARSRERIRELMAEAHVFALPSVVAPDGRAEGIPVALMEAMAMERPVVSTRTSGIPELIEDGRSGWLVAPADPAALADALAQIHADPLRAAQRAREARRVVRERFDLDENAGRLHRLLAEPQRTPLPSPVAGRIVSRAGLGGVGR